jgi:nucleoid-associated protein YgaU
VVAAVVPDSTLVRQMRTSAPIASANKAAASAPQNDDDIANNSDSSDNTSSQIGHDEAAVREHARAIQVQSGDTLQVLASRYLGSGGPEAVARMEAANPQLDDPNQIVPGETVYVPTDNKQTVTEK